VCGDMASETALEEFSGTVLSNKPSERAPSQPKSNSKAI
jgi:hypothetical protein